MVLFSIAAVVSSFLTHVKKTPNHIRKENLTIVEQRGLYFPKCLYYSFQTPLFVTRAQDHFYYGPDGVKYVDLYNNVCHIGHSDPHVLRAVTESYSTININTRYLTPALTNYAEHLQAYLPKGFKILFTNSGSEANDLALQIALAALAQNSKYTIGAFEKSYHGTTFLCQQASHLTPTGVIQPQTRRINLQFFPPEQDENLLRNMPDVKAFILESVQGVGGNVEISTAWMQAIRRQVDVMICDEVQTGFGRSGGTFWAFEKANIIPDIITCGKPIANGYPMGACIFHEKMEQYLPPFYFNTFGGNSAACTVAKVVLEQIEAKGIVRHAAEMGVFLKDQLAVMLGDKVEKITGMGLFIGVVFRKGVNVKEIVEKLKEHKMIVGIGYNDILRIKPPMTVDRETLKLFVDTLRAIV